MGDFTANLDFMHHQKGYCSWLISATSYQIHSVDPKYRSANAAGVFSGSTEGDRPRTRKKAGPVPTDASPLLDELQP
jgi:hypothetical protein